MIKLRPYQQELIDKTRNLMQQGSKSVLICSPCGSGKTLLTAQMLKTAAEKGMPSICAKWAIRCSMLYFKERTSVYSCKTS